MRARAVSGGVAALGLATLVDLANAGTLPDGHTPLGVAKLLARESKEASGEAIVLLSASIVDLFAVEAPAEKQDSDALPALPEWIEVVPAPLEGADEGHVETRDWRIGFICDPQKIVDAFNDQPESRRAKILDWEHKTHRNWGCDRNPAAGWIEELKVGDDGKSVWARIDWTPEGRDDVRHKRYRYVSPVVAITWPGDSEGNVDWDAVPIATELLDAALTNNPATFIRDLARTPAGDSEDESENSSAGAGALAASVAPPRASKGGPTEDGEIMKFSKEALSALGLPEDATQEQIEKALLSTLAKPPTSSAAAQPPQPTPAGFDMEALKSAISEAVKPLAAKVEKLEQGEKKSAAEILDAQLNSIIDSGVAAFKVTPASREDLLEMGRAVGPDKLRAYVDKQPSQIHLSQPVGAGQRTAPQDEKKLTAAELAIASKVGMSPDAMRKAKQTLREDGGRFKHGVSLMRRPKDDTEDEAAA